MNYEETLGILLSYVGSHVVVRVCEAKVPYLGGESPPIIARMGGVLAHARRLDERWTPDLHPRDEELHGHVDDMFFTVGEDGNGFFIRPRLFRSAEPLSDTALWISLVDTVLDIRQVTA